jgi:hypothetical protein
MSKAKESNAVSTTLSVEDFAIGLRKGITMAIDGEKKQTQGYDDAAQLCLDYFRPLELEHGRVFESVLTEEKGNPFADAVNEIMTGVKAMAKELGHKSPRAVVYKIRTHAEKLRKAPTVSDSSGNAQTGDNSKPIGEFLVERIKACYNKCCRQAETTESKAVRSQLRECLSKLGVKVDTDKTLYINKQD